MISQIQNEVVRRNQPTAPRENSPHLISAGNTFPGDPLPQAGNGDAADLAGCIFDGQASGLDMFGELHTIDIPHYGEHRQPRNGECERRSSSRIQRGMGNQLRNLRMSRGWTHERAAEAVGVSRSQLIKLERGERQLTSHYIERIAKAFDVPPASVIAEVVDNGEGIPIVGLAGAGPQGSVLFGHTDGGFGFGPAAPNSGAATVALEVSGDSMRGTANDGWLVYYDDEPSAPKEDMIGELCVVGLEDDRVLVKVLQPGKGEGLYDLESYNAPVMRDVPVRWASLVTSIIPRKPARRLLRDE